MHVSFEGKVKILRTGLQSRREHERAGTETETDREFKRKNGGEGQWGILFSAF
jgi:hypothetical protein